MAKLSKVEKQILLILVLPRAYNSSSSQFEKLQCHPIYIGYGSLFEMDTAKEKRACLCSNLKAII